MHRGERYEQYSILYKRSLAMVNLLIKSVDDAMEMCAARTRNREDFQFNREYSYTLQVMRIGAHFILNRLIKVITQQRKTN